MKLGILPTAALLCIFVSGCSEPKADPAKPTTATGNKLQNGIAMGKDELADKQGVPIYPGAIAPEGQSSVTQGNGETKYDLELATSDQIKKVNAFYVEKFPSASSVCNAIGCDIMVQTPKGTYAQIKIGTKEGKTSISVIALVGDAPKPKQ